MKTNSLGLSRFDCIAYKLVRYSMTKENKYHSIMKWTQRQSNTTTTNTVQDNTWILRNFSMMKKKKNLPSNYFEKGHNVASYI